jgi:hypothetical protein
VSEAIVKLKKRHVNQQLIFDTAKRFNVLKCGRRFGKTSFAEELIIDPALDGFPVAYYAPTYKDLAEFWHVLTNILRDVVATKNEQLKQLRLITGGVIDMWSLDDPDSGRGRKYRRVVVDECEKAAKLEQAWKGTIRALLTDFKGDCWFLSTPKFGQTYFKQLFKYRNDPKFEHEWQSWKFTTYDNPHIDPDEVDAAKRTLDPLYFACEYLAEDIDLVNSPFVFAFSREKHLSQQTIEPTKAHELYLSFDFNRNPITCTVIQHYDGCIRVIECIKLRNSNIYELCVYILSKYPNFLYIITGDATGKGSTALVQDNLNYYRVIAQKLNLTDGQIKVPSVNPRIEDNQVLVNSVMQHYPVQISATGCDGLIFDLENVRLNADGKIDKANRQDETQQADALDTWRYYLNTFFGWFLKTL